MASPALTPTAAGVKVGDFFVSSWGYDQTNIDFYKVVGLTPKGVKVQKWGSKRLDVDTGGYTDAVVPGNFPATTYNECRSSMSTAPGPARVKQKTLRGDSDRPYFSVNSYSIARLWDGNPKHQTASGYGH